MSKTVFDEILSKGHDGRAMPDSAKKSCTQMAELIRDSDSPADVSLACCMGLAYATSCAKNPDEIMEAIIQISLRMKADIDAIKLSGGDTISEWRKSRD